jgi:hypothetical protein
MIINGVELDFRLYDEDKADIKDRYFEELKKMKGIKDKMPEGSERERNKYLCDRIKGFFDRVFGEGTGAAACGEGNDLLEHLRVYDAIVTEQLRQQEEYKLIMDHLKSVKGINK